MDELTLQKKMRNYQEEQTKENQKRSSENKALSIHLNENALADFILNFLGRKEKLIYNDKLYFLIRLNDFEQFYYLLNDKLSKEQNIFIDHFHVSITYNDKTKREISGIKGLNSFVETRDVIPKDVTLSWKIIVQYPNAKTLETQTVDLTFILNKEKSAEGEILLTINHTNQVWGIEVVNLIKDKIKLLTIFPSKKYKIAKIVNYFLDYKIISNLTSMLMAAVMLIIVNATSTYKNSPNYYNLFSSIGNFEVPSDQIQLAIQAAEKLDSKDLSKFISDEIVKDPRLNENLKSISETKKIFVLDMFWWIICSIFFIFIFLKFYSKKVMQYYKIDSYILINSKSENEYKNDIQSKSTGEFISITLVFISITCGIIANFIYQSIRSW
ncbi:MAG: hypothetical protein NDI81_01115 [Desulfobacula sp.]|nr:hypothetical protein [Desulfobacula sp.]